MDWLMELLSAVSFHPYFWFMVAFALAGLQLVTDEFFFGGACIGAFLTAVTLMTVDPQIVKEHVNLSLPYVLCGLGGLLGAILLRRAARKSQAGHDINEEPYDGDAD